MKKILLFLLILTFTFLTYSILKKSPIIMLAEKEFNSQSVNISGHVDSSNYNCFTISIYDSPDLEFNLALKNKSGRFLQKVLSEINKIDNYDIIELNFASSDGENNIKHIDEEGDTIYVNLVEFSFPKSSLVQVNE